MNKLNLTQFLFIIFICFVSPVSAYAAVPTVTAISPTAGPTAGGTAVTITGTDFTGATSVTIGGSAVTDLTIGATSITGNTPTGAAGAKDVVVTTPSGTGTGTGLFTYVAPTYNVIYNGNNNTSGTAPTDLTNYASGALVTVASNTGTLARTGYTFGGWNTQADGLGTNYTAGSGTFNITANTTLYAQWSINSYTVTFDANTGTGTMSTQSSNYNVASNLTTNGFTKTGYTFTGWNTVAGGGGTAYADGASYPFTADVTLYAQWSINSYTVTFDANTGTGTMSAQSSDYNVAANLTANGFTKTGYTFTGWNTVAGGGGTAYADGASYPFTADVTLYAQWSINSYTVTFDANTGTGTMSAQSSDYNVAANLTANGFTKTGYTFTGWNTVAGGGGTAYADGASYPFTADVTLYAQWAATVPGAPTIGTATAGNTQATAAFTAPASDGGSAITGYTATSSPGSFTSSGCTTSPCTVTGLTDGIAYTFTVTATNAIGTGAASAASNSVTPDSPPVITPPADVTVNAIGLFTPVSIGTATASDTTDGTLTPTSNAPSHFAPGVHLVTWSATDGMANTVTATQWVNVNPMVNLSNDQITAEGSTVSFSIILNGDAVTYPVTVPYTVSGSALTDGSDHNLSDGTAIIISGTEVAVSFSTIDDGAGEGVEDVIITLGVPTNAVTGAQTVLTVSLVESNVAPVVSLSADQGNGNSLTVTQADGFVVVSSIVTDPNVGDAHSYDWSMTDNALVDTDGIANDDSFSFNPMTVSPGFYSLHLSVNDGSDSGSSDIMLEVVVTAPVLTTADSDGDGTDDQTEGYGDSDGDGIADYLDAIDASNVLPELAGEYQRYLIETEPGLGLVLGNIALQSDNAQAAITMTDVTNAGSISDSAAYNHDAGLFDFVVTAVASGQTVNIAIPQLEPVPANVTYRSLTSAGWQTFSEDDNNLIFSAAGEAGYCPPPGDAAYLPGLTVGDLCVQLTIADGGLNDADGEVNNRVANIGGVSQRVVRNSDDGWGLFGLGSLHPMWLLILGLLPLQRRLVKRKLH